MADLMEFTPAEGPVESYQAEVHLQRTAPQRFYFMARVKACPAPGSGLNCGPWSDWSNPIYLSEAPQMLALPVLLLALVALRWRKEILKQLIDQPLHVLMNVASVLTISTLMLALLAYTVLQTLPIMASEVALVWGVGMTALWNIVREVRQWPSSRWWDPPLDWLFEVGGIVAGGFVFWIWVAPALV